MLYSDHRSVSDIDLLYSATNTMDSQVKEIVEKNASCISLAEPWLAGVNLASAVEVLTA